MTESTRVSRGLLGLVLTCLAAAPPGCTIVDFEPPPADPAAAECPPYSAEASHDLTPLPNAPAQHAGELAGSFAVGTDGAATYTVPLEVPRGRLGMQPSLSIAYSSNGGVGTLGVGFQLTGFSAIERCPSNRADDGLIRGVQLDVKDQLCLDGARLVPIAEHVHEGKNVREYRTFPDSRRRVVGFYRSPADGPTDQPEWLIVQEPSGNVASYGTTPNSRFELFDGGRQSALRWLLASVSDPRRNRMDYVYEKDVDPTDGHTLAMRPLRIEYGANAAGDAAQPTRWVSFAHEMPNVVFANERHYALGEKVAVPGSRLLTRVETWADGAPVRSYRLDYEISSVRHQLLLRDVRECPGLGATGCKPALRFGWNDQLESQVAIHRSLDLPRWPLQMMSKTVADVTGDGLPDLIVSVTNPEDAPNARETVWQVARGTGSMSVPFLPFEEWVRFRTPAGVESWSVTPLDYDDDGINDLLVDSSDDRSTHSLLVLRSSPSRQFQLVSTGIPRNTTSGGSYYGAPVHSTWKTVDVDADGKLDLVECIDDRTTPGHPAYVENECITDGDVCLPSMARWSVRRWTPTGGLVGQPGFSVTPEPIDALAGITCVTNVVGIDLDGDGQNELLMGGRDPASPSGVGWFAHRFDLATQAWQAQRVGLPLLSSSPLLLRNLTTPLAGGGGGLLLNHRLLFPDLNGDGLPDVLFFKAFSGGSPDDQAKLMSHPVYLNTGRGLDFVASSASYPVGFGSENDRYFVFDYNSDGRDDLVMYKIDAGWRVYLTNGVGQAPTEMALTSDAHGIRPPVDIDGDGRSDFYGFSTDADGWPYVEVLENRINQLLVTKITSGRNPLNGPTPLWGPPLDPGDPGFVPDVEIHYDRMIDRAADSPAGDPRLHTVAYRPRTDPENGCSYPRSCFLSLRPVVHRYAVNNGQSQRHQFSLQYRDGRFDRAGRGFLGFGERVLRDLDAETATVERFDNRTYDPTFRVYPFAGAALKSFSFVHAKPGDSLPTRVDMEIATRVLEVQPTNQGRTFLLRDVSARTTKKAGFLISAELGALRAYATDPDHDAYTLTDHHVLNESFDALGYPWKTTEWSDGGPLQVTTRTIEHDLDAWRLDRVRSTSVCSSTPEETHCNVVEHLYNGLGELRESFRAPQMPSAYLHTTLSRDAYGNVVHVSAEDWWGQRREACTTYEPNGIFPWAQRNGAGHLSYTVFETGLGVLASSRDANGLLTKHRHDAFGRRVETHRPDGNVVEMSADRVWNGTWRTLLTKREPGAGELLVELDTLGRVARTRRQGPDVATLGSQGYSTSAPWFVQDWYYDFFGRLDGQSIAYLAGDPTAGQHIARRSYDAAGRLVREVSPANATTTYSYGLDAVQSQPLSPRWATERVTKITPGTADVAPPVTTTYHDALGRVARVRDAKGGEVRYGYGPFSRLRAVEGVDGLVTDLDLDAYGRLMHRHDADRGDAWMEYDGFDQLRDTLDAQSRTTHIDYDALGRVLTRDDRTVDGVIADHTAYRYDTAPHGIGALHFVEMPGANGTHVRTMSYDGLSRPESVTLTYDDGLTLTSSTTYDAFGRVHELVYPSTPGTPAFSVFHQYAADGRLKQVSGASGRIYWTLDKVDGNTGRAAAERLGGTMSTERAYDARTGALEYIFTTAPGGAILQNAGYEYDARQNLSARVDHLQPTSERVERFHHDALDRLTCARLTSCALNDPLCAGPQPPLDQCDTGIVYAPNGNIAQKSDIGTYHYDPVAHPHAVEHTTGATPGAYTYDAVGNQISRPGISDVLYTLMNLPRRYTLAPSGDTIDYDYDSDGTRIRKTTPTEDVRYFGGLVERIEQGGVVEYRYSVRNGERVVAVVSQTGAEPGAPRYLHVDNLGSTSVVTDPVGAVLERHAHDAFGARRNHVWSSSQPPSPLASAFTSSDYTGHELDAEVGLVNAKGRIYDPALGRFLQTDPVIADVTASQSWNPYSYVENRPLRFTDPSGYTGDDTVPYAADGYDANNRVVRNAIVVFADSEIVGRNPYRDGLAPDKPTRPDSAPVVEGASSPTMAPQLPPFYDPGRELNVPDNAQRYAGIRPQPFDVGLLAPQAVEVAAGVELANAFDVNVITPIVRWIKQERPKYLDSDHNVVEYQGHVDHTDAIPPLAEVGLTAAAPFISPGLTSDQIVVHRFTKNPTRSEEFGRIIGWGEGQRLEDIEQTINATNRLTDGRVEKMNLRGVEREWVEKQLEMYTRASKDPHKLKANAQIPQRKKLMEEILRRWPKPEE